MFFKNISAISVLLILLLPCKGFCQQKESSASNHKEGVASPVRTYQYGKGRPFKTSIDAGLVFGFAGTDSYYAHYANSFSASMGYTFGLTEEIPVQRTSYIEAGVEILQDGVSFNSYFFAPEYSFLYNGQENYFHTITMNEIQVPLLYKFQLGPMDRKCRLLYMTFGGKFRYISYTNTTITDNNTGSLLWEGQKDVSADYRLFSPFGSAVFETSLGYQRNVKNKKKRGWYMNLEYNYGLSPLVYTGNRDGSNYVIFHLNTLIFKIGKIF